MTVYEIVHRLPNGHELVLHTVDSRAEVTLLVDTARYDGTWLDESKKLLRYGMGLIVVRKVSKVLEVINEELIDDFGITRCKLEIANHKVVGWLVMSSNSITAYDHSYNIRLWHVDSFAELANTLGKEIAYECMQRYERLPELKGAM